MSETPSDAARVARGLTAFQRNQISALPEGPVTYDAIYGSNRTGLFRKHLLENCSLNPLLMRLTPLGLAVRAHLLKESDQHG